ncbi:MAG: hydrogenase 4 subunit F [Rikenellaceae bacterium]|nr:hydrogenase 4 subunit F [Rikenellaceae bacterium]
MALIIVLITFIASVAIISVSRRSSVINMAMSAFCFIQLLSVVLLFTNRESGSTSLFFNIDNIGLLFHSIMVVVSTLAIYQGRLYLTGIPVRELKIYDISILCLCISLMGVYYSDNIVITWVFLEATTLASAGLVYHHRNIKNLEATWKYIFVSSVGLTVAYLGILLLSTTVGNDGSLTYSDIKNVFVDADPLYMKLAFLFTLIGYSTKMEIFPFFAIGVDANYSAPSPASSLISSGLVNGGFVAFYRIYALTVDSEIYVWVKNVLLITGLASIVVGALYLRHTNNIKRFLSYSTVENVGIVILGLGLGGMAVFGALLHIAVHSIIKSSMFLQISKVGKLFNTYRINRIGDYLRVDQTGGLLLVIGMISLTALPPSALFVSELIIIKEMISGGHWLVLFVFIVCSCYVIYSIVRRILYIQYKKDRKISDSSVIADPKWKVSTWVALVIVLLTMLLGVSMPAVVINFIKGMMY